MKLLTKTPIKQIDGKNYKDIDDVVIKTPEDLKKAPDLTLGKVIGKTLSTIKSTDPWKSYKLANDFIKDEVNLKAEDIVFIVELVKQADYYPYVLGQVIEMLENGNQPIEKNKEKKKGK